MALESPYYGKRRPQGQQGAKLGRVSDLLTLGRATIEESLCLLNWAQHHGFPQLGPPLVTQSPTGLHCIVPYTA